MSTTSASLLKRLRSSGEKEAWVRFVELYTPLVYYLVRIEGIPSSDVDDLVQDVFTVLVQKMPEFKYDRRKKFRAWLAKVTRNKCVDFQRRQSHLPQVGYDPQVSQTHHPDDAELISKAEYCRYVTQRALQLMQAELPPTTYQAIHRHIVLDQPAAEVARQLGMTVNAVYVAKSRVLRRIREELSGLLD